MTEEEFNKIFAEFIKFEEENHNYYFYEAKVDTNTNLYWEWSEGGASGGSCWDEGPDDGARPFYGSSPPSETPLDRFLEKHFPNIAYLTYNKIRNKLTEDSRSDVEYYGNYEDFSVRYINRKTLYDMLKGEKCELSV